MFLLDDDELNWETFDKDNDYFKILIESMTNLRSTYKDRDQFNSLLKNILWNNIIWQHRSEI